MAKIRAVYEGGQLPDELLGDKPIDWCTEELDLSNATYSPTRPQIGSRKPILNGYRGPAAICVEVTVAEEKPPMYKSGFYTKTLKPGDIRGIKNKLNAK
jgi:hypothetical protein